MVTFPNNPDDLERFRRAAGNANYPNVAPTVAPRLPQRQPTVQPVRPAPRPGFTYQPGTPGYESLNIFQRAGVLPHYNVPRPAPNVTPAVTGPAAATPTVSPSGVKSPIQQLYEFLKGDLTREATKARAAAEVDAASRGVYYGQPLTAMGTDIDERYQRGLAALQASLIQNEQQNELERMRMALASLGPLPQGEAPPFPADAFANLAAAFMPQPAAPGAAAPVGNTPPVPPGYRRVGGRLEPIAPGAQ